MLRHYEDVLRSGGQVAGPKAKCAACDWEGSLSESYARPAAGLPKWVIICSILVLTLIVTLFISGERDWLQSKQARVLDDSSVPASASIGQQQERQRNGLIREKLIFMVFQRGERASSELDIYLDISRDESVLFNHVSIAATGDSQLAELTTKLGSIVQRYGEKPQVLISADPGVACRRVLDVLNVCEAAGIRNVSFKLSSEPTKSTVAIACLTETPKLRRQNDCIVLDVVRRASWSCEFFCEGIKCERSLAFARRVAERGTDTAYVRIAKDDLDSCSYYHFFSDLTEILVNAHIKNCLLAIYVPCSDK